MEVPDLNKIPFDLVCLMHFEESLHSPYNYLVRNFDSFVDFYRASYFTEASEPRCKESIMKGESPEDVLLFSASIGDLEYCKHLVREYGVKISVEDNSSMSIFDVVGDEEFRIFQWAIASKQLNHTHHQKLFYNMVCYGQLKCVKWIVEHYDVDIHANHDEAIRVCYESISRECADWLIENGADIHAQDDELYREIKDMMERDKHGGHDEHFKWISSFGGH